MHLKPEAKELAPQQSALLNEKFGICRIGSIRIAIPIEALSEVCKISLLSDLPIKSPILCGGISLREQLIPVINFPKICGLPEPTIPPQYAVVIRRSAHRLAVLVDQVLGIAQIDSSRINILAPSTDNDPSTCIRQLFVDGEHVISILDVESFFSLPGVFAAEVRSNIGPASIDDGRIPMLTFMVGSAQFAIDATDVYATFPRQSIEIGAMSSGYCLGSITYHQRRIPVIDAVKLLGLGRQEAKRESAVVVLHCSSDRLIGLAVDTIQDIRRVDLGLHAGPPKAITGHHNFITKVIIQDQGTQTFVLSAENLSNDPGVSAIASLSSHPIKTHKALGDEVRTNMSRFLVVHLGRDFAIPLEQVTSIIPLPTDLVPTAQTVNGLIGFFARPPYSVPLIDLNSVMHRTPQNNSLVRVLLTGEGEEQVGFQVERISSIETSNWRLEGLRNTGPEAETLVQLGDGAARRAAPVLDLDALAKRFLSVRG